MFLGLNIISLRKKFDKLQILNDSLKEPPDIIALIETWLSPGDPLDFYFLQGFQKIVSKPKTIGKCGGVAVFLKEGISYSLMDYETDQECLFLSIKEKNKVKGYICVLYRPPSANLDKFFNFFESMFHFLRTINSKTLIFRDFNINILEQSSRKKKFCEIIESLGYQFQNNEPTRKTNLTSSCIDHIITEDNLVCKTYEFLDHYPISSKVPFWLHSIDQKRIIKYRNLNQLTDQKLLNFFFLLDQNLKTKSTESTDGKIQFIVSTIMQTPNRYAPEKISYN